MRPAHLISCLIAGLALLALWPLGTRLAAQLVHLQAAAEMREGATGSAARKLETAVALQPGDPGMWKDLGKAYHHAGKNLPPPKAYEAADKAKSAFVTALDLDPLDAESYYCAGREEGRLGQLFPRVRPGDENPHNALPYFKEAVRLRPGSLLYRYSLVQYLYFTGRITAMLWAVTDLVATCPRAYDIIKNEAFWSPPVRDHVEAGLKEAVSEDISPYMAHRALSTIYAEEENWTRAMAHFRKHLEAGRGEPGAAAYLHLGRLGLNAGLIQEAEGQFMKAFEAGGDRVDSLETLYRAYKSRGRADRFPEFYKRLDKSATLPPGSKLVLARAWMDLRLYDKAGAVLSEVNRREPSAEAYYLTAVLARKQEKWDAMEIAIQKATVLDPRNSRYHMMFSQVLRRMDKLQRAEKEAGRAIRDRENPRAGHYHYRAVIRWDLKDYRGALDDWKSAISLDPEKAAYYAGAARALLELGDAKGAASFYEKALRRDPDNPTYRKRSKALSP